MRPRYQCGPSDTGRDMEERAIGRRLRGARPPRRHLRAARSRRVARRPPASSCWRPSSRRSPWHRWSWLGVAAARRAVVRRRARRGCAGCGASCSACLAVARAHRRAWADLAPDRARAVRRLGRPSSVDPQPSPGATRVVCRSSGERFEMWVRGRARSRASRRGRVAIAVVVGGDARPLDAERARRVAWQHVVGRSTLDVARRSSAPATRWPRRRTACAAVIDRGAGARCPPTDAALSRGLVIGDDRDQPPAMVERSGERAVAPHRGVRAERRASCSPPPARCCAGCGRWPRLAGDAGADRLVRRADPAEPSVLRAGVMAGLGGDRVRCSAASASRRGCSPCRRSACCSSTRCSCWSVGFWLSVGATAGVTVVGPWLAPGSCASGRWRCRWRSRSAPSCGVALPSLLVFGRLPLVGRGQPARRAGRRLRDAVRAAGVPARRRRAGRRRRW